MRSVPAIETPRLILRSHSPEDFSACSAMWGDAAVTRFIRAQPFSPEEVWAKLLRYTGHWQWLGFGYWALEDKATGDFVGELGFADFKRDLNFSGKGAPELGWALASRFHGKGYATEAVRAALSWGDRHFDGASTICLIHPENRSSIRVAEKCGYVEAERVSYNGHPVIVFKR